MNQIIEDPFAYEEKPQWLVLKLREENRAKREKKLGRTVGKWGGHRPGAGRPKVRTYDFMVGISMTNVQKLTLLEMGKGDLADGVNALIKEYL